MLFLSFVTDTPSRDNYTIDCLTPSHFHIVWGALIIAQSHRVFLFSSLWAALHRLALEPAWHNKLYYKLDFRIPGSNYSNIEDIAESVGKGVFRSIMIMANLARKAAIVNVIEGVGGSLRYFAAVFFSRRPVLNRII